MAGDDPGLADDRDDDWWDREDDRYRGWIDPDDRLWRHPSEGAAAPGRPTSGAPGLGGPFPRPSGAAHGRLARRGSAPWLICGSLCVALAVAAVAVVMADTGSDPTTAITTSFGFLRSAPTTEPGSESLADGTVRAALSGIRQSTVALEVARAGDVATVAGVVAEAGGIVVTTAGAVAGATGITAVEPDGGRGPASVVAVDRISDLAVLRIPDDLPAATFEDGDPSVGTMAMAVAVRPRGAGQPAPLLYAGPVLSSGTSMSANTTTADFSVTAVRTPLERSDVGCALVDDQGRLTGLLDSTVRSGTSRVAVFLPATLVAGVTRQLVASGEVDHGWLGAAGSDGSPSTAVTETSSSSSSSSSPSPPSGAAGSGAELSAVSDDSPAARSGLAPGDVVVAVDGAPVHSMAELKTRLYPDPPGTDVAVTYERSQTTQTVEVQLGDPGTDPDTSRSP